MARVDVRFVAAALEQHGVVVAKSKIAHDKVSGLKKEATGLA